MKTKEFAYQVLERSKVPLSYKQIWEKGKKFGLDKELEYNGSNIAININSTLSQDINAHGTASKFIRMSSNPVLYGLANKAAEYNQNQPAIERAYEKAVAEEEKESEKDETSGDYGECDLHPILVKYLINASHFNCNTRTIVQQEGEQPPKGVDKWRYPDLIGVYDIRQTGEYSDCTLGVMDSQKANPFRVFSFEMKKTITVSKAREYYFQAVSNSSWANEGYLVAAVIDEDNKDLMKELALLNNLFGIGIIKLDIVQPSASKILFPAREKESIDFGSLNVLINRSGKDGAVRQIFEFISGRSYGKRSEDVFDKVFDDEEYNEKTKNGKMIKGLSGRKK